VAKKKSVPLLHPAPNWQPPLSRYVVLWHGCTDSDRASIEQQGVNPAFGKIDTDFGRGFYTTSLRRQAEQWAWLRYFDQKRASPPVVLWFRILRRSLARMDFLGFVRGDYRYDDYWSLVQHCRQSLPANARDHAGPHQGWYDVVMGPVAAMWRQRVAMLGADQTSFHTKRAAKLLTDAMNSGDPHAYGSQIVS
jgi:hypothetical protein